MMELKIVVGVVLAALLLWSYSFIGEHAVAEYKVKQAGVQAEADKAQQEKYNTIAESFESMKYIREQKAKTITKVVEKVVEKEVYRNVCADTDGVEAANAALRGDL